MASKRDTPVTFQIKGMKSEESEAKAGAALKAVPGVTLAKVDYSTRTAVVVYDPAKVKVQELIAALKKAGFTASEAQAKYICPKCQGTYQAGGACLICEATLQPISSASSQRKEK